MHWNGVGVFFYFFIQIDFLVQVNAKRKDSHGYKTTYACEGRTLNIQCDDGIIHLIRANYGRFSISICNDHGNLDWSVNCMSHQSFLVMQERCSFKPNCSVNVSSNTFHDPCPGTLKYLEVQYHCGKDPPSVNVHPSSSSHLSKSLLPNTTTVPGPSPIYPTITFTPVPPTILPITDAVHMSVPWPYGRDIITQSSVVTEGTFPLVTKREEVQMKEILPSPSIDYASANYCAPVYARGINWMWTKPGETAVEKCPVGATGTARWHCLLDTADWSPESPDLFSCRSMWLENLRERLENGESIISVTSELAVKSYEKPLFSADLQIISDMIKQALYLSANSMENFLDTWHRYRVLRELLQCFVQIISNLLEREESAAWTDLPSHDRKMIISSLLHALDESALLLSEISNDDGSFSVVKNNVLLSLQILNSKALTAFHFPIRNEIATDEKGILWLSMQDSMLLPRQAVKEYGSNGLYKVVFTAFNKLNNFLVPSSNFQRQAKDSISSNVTRVINSKIIGASLDRGGYPKLLQPAVITLKHIMEENVTNPTCVYWDFHFRDWSTQGCWVQTSNRSHTVCLCEHLTNFAVIMDIQADAIIPLDLRTLHIIIAIGCSIAIFSLLVTVIIMFIFSLDMPDDSLFIHRNMFLCLLLSEILLVGGIRQTTLPLLCAIIAGCLQYLLLVTFFWMLLECYHQYVSLIRTCDVKKRNACWYYLAAYVIPGLITGISAAVNPLNYGDSDYCWLQSNNYFIFSFAAPAAIIILGGFIFIILAVCMLSQNVTIVQEKDSIALIKHRSWNRRSLFLIILSTITWTMGLVFLSQESLFLAYTFSVLNSAHGIAILILYCFGYEKISRDLRNIFSNIFWKKRKESEPQISEHTNDVMHTNDSIQRTNERSRSLKENKFFEKPVLQGYTREETYKGEGTLKFHRGSMSRGMRANANWTYSRSALEGNTDSSSSGECRQNFTTSPESSGQFFDHIYEAIDEPTRQTMSTQHSGNNRVYPPPENYYGDHSDISQQSSSSSGYNRQTQGPGSHQGEKTYITSYSLDRSPVQQQDQGFEYTWEQYKESICDKDAYETSGIMPMSSTPNESTQPTSASGVLWQKNSPKNWESQVPNILQSPTENTVVLAVLEGDKVVSRLQQDDALIQQQYKLNTYY